VFEIEHFLAVAEGVLGVDAHRLAPATNIGLAESALAAPYASFGGHDLYSHPIKKASILASRIIRNHALPDGNKRVAFILMDLYLQENGYRFTGAPGETDRMFRAVAGGGQTEDYFHAWLISRTERIGAGAK
jgi:death-on-curing protein